MSDRLAAGSGSWTAQSESLLLSIPQAAAALSLSRATIYEMFARGELSRVKVGRRAFVRRADLIAYVDALTEV